LGKKETGAQAALPIWLEFMQAATQSMPIENFQNVVPLERLAGTKQVLVDVPDTAPPADLAEQGMQEKPVPVLNSPQAKPVPKIPEPASTHTSGASTAPVPPPR
jgi:penicillin-binding protein 1A